MNVKQLPLDIVDYTMLALCCLLHSRPHQFVKGSGPTAINFYDGPYSL